MGFDTNQASYKQFRETLKQRTVPIVIWAGAGLSAPSGIPSWSELEQFIIKRAEDKVARVDENVKEVIKAHLKLASVEQSAWKRFENLKRALGDTDYTSAMHEAFQSAGKASIPKLYTQFWNLGINGFFTLNIDRIAARAFSENAPGTALREFDGGFAQRHGDLFISGQKFVVNLHGNIDDAQSWVFTETDFEGLMKKPGYAQLINTCFTARIVLFAGISADDRAAGGHLEKLREMGVNLNRHFWLTNRNDLQTVKWAGQTGVNQIFYESKSQDHSQVGEFIKDLLLYVPQETVPPPVSPPRLVIDRAIPSPEELERLPANEIRIHLNGEANRILSSGSPDKIKQYSNFIDKYNEAAYRAWSISTTPPKNQFFDYTLIKPLAAGAFGNVFEAASKDGKRVAIKILRGDVRQDPEMLVSFRRGVQSMKILSERQVPGMVPYLAAWEVPASSVMEIIDGPNLEDAVMAGYVEDWETRLKIALRLTSIIRNAHGVVERVLHRDIRPANIMLKGYYSDINEWEVVVLDFDLSWHRDAAEGSLDLGTSSNGYLSPEQTDRSRKKLTRNALVDSYGLGMTIYFLATGKHPKVGQHRYSDWYKILKSEVCAVKCDFWKSLPYRVARLIDSATKDNQSDRWDVARINGELVRLMATQKGASNISSAEMFAEEIVIRAPELSVIYVWDDQKLGAYSDLRSGFSIRVIGDESEKKIKLFIDWMQTGDRKFENVRKYIDAGAEKSCSFLKKGGWRITAKGTVTGECHIQAHLTVSELRNLETLNIAAKSLNESIAPLRFN